MLPLRMLLASPDLVLMLPLLLLRRRRRRLAPLAPRRLLARRLRVCAPCQLRSGCVRGVWHDARLRLCAAI